MGYAAGGDSPLGAWILNLPRIRLHTFSHALLPQRGAADSPASRIPPGEVDVCVIVCLLVGWLVHRCLMISWLDS